MEITDNWTVKRVAVCVLGMNQYGIETWGVYVDGCLSRVVQPHIQACLDVMELSVGALHPGTTSPFFTVVDRPARNTYQAMEVFAELFAMRKIEGQYCDEPGRAMFLEHHQPAGLLNINRHGDCYEVVIRGNDKLSLGQLKAGVASCMGINRPQDRRFVELIVKADDMEELSAALRLLGNVAAIRWDRDDYYTRGLLKEPLL